VIGHSLPNVGALGATVKLGGRILLIDGVDMKLASAGQVINRANRVAHAFWEYSRARKAFQNHSDRLALFSMECLNIQARSEKLTTSLCINSRKRRT
jgi:hypothetical protein